MSIGINATERDEMGIARATLVGNLTSDPRGNEAETVCNLRVAVNMRRKISDEWQDVVGFYDVVVIGGRAKTCLEYLAKGRQVAIDGRLQWREWEKDGAKRQSVEILADEVQFIGSRGEDSQSGDASSTEPAASSDDGPGW